MEWTSLTHAAAAVQVTFLDAFLAALCFVVIASVVVFILVAVWMYRDAESRGMSGGLWVVVLILASLLFAFLGGLVVLILYFILRSDHPVRYGAYAPATAPYPPPMYPPGPAPPRAAQPPAPASAAVRCRACGAPLPPGAAFCTSCGTRV